MLCKQPEAPTASAVSSQIAVVHTTTRVAPPSDRVVVDPDTRCVRSNGRSLGGIVAWAQVEARDVPNASNDAERACGKRHGSVMGALECAEKHKQSRASSGSLTFRASGPALSWE